MKKSSMILVLKVRDRSLGGWANAKKSSFYENGYVINQFKWNEAYNNMLANSLPLHTPLTPGMGSKDIFWSSHAAFQINGNEA